MFPAWAKVLTRIIQLPSERAEKARFARDECVRYRALGRGLSSPRNRQRSERNCLQVDRERFTDWGVTPRPSCDEARDIEARNSPERISEDLLRGTRCRQVHTDHRLHLDDARGDFDQP